VVWDEEPALALPGQLALARVRRVRRTGLMTDAFSLPAFARQMLAAFCARTRIETPEGTITFDSVEEMKDALCRPDDANVLWLSAEQSNSSLIVDDAVMLKIFRKVSAGEHPEAEMGRYLTAQGFLNTPALLGEVARTTNNGERHALAVAQAFIRNQGDAWSWTLDRFNHALDGLATPEGGAEERADEVADYTAIAAAIGKRLGEMHAVLARGSDDPAFAPETAGAQAVEGWVKRAVTLLERAFGLLRKQIAWDSETVEAQAKRLLSQQELLTRELKRLAKAGVGSVMSRIHGDFHLGQVLVASGDVYLIDFEGEPGRPLADRRAKASPLRDVAGLLRSLDYAAAATLDPKKLTAARLPAEQREEFIMSLRDGAERAFLEAYRAASGAAVEGELLSFFLIEKAAYELAYEAANRPSWLLIPVTGLARLAARIQQTTRSEP
jgi:maltose alpha-D-glucosyltransferase/alpha-amylase